MTLWRRCRSILGLLTGQVIATAAGLAGALVSLIVLGHHLNREQLSLFLACAAVAGLVFGGITGAAYFGSLTQVSGSGSLNKEVARSAIILTLQLALPASTLSIGILVVTQGERSLACAIFTTINQSATMVAAALAGADLGQKSNRSSLILGLGYGLLAPLSLFLMAPTSAAGAAIITALAQIVITACILLYFRLSGSLAPSVLAPSSNKSPIVPTILASAALLAATRLAYFHPAGPNLAALFVALRVFEAARTAQPILLNVMTPYLLRGRQALDGIPATLASSVLVGSGYLGGLCLVLILPPYLNSVIPGIRFGWHHELIACLAAVFVIDASIWSFHFTFLTRRQAWRDVLALTLGLTTQLSCSLAGMTAYASLLIGALITLAGMGVVSLGHRESKRLGLLILTLVAVTVPASDAASWSLLLVGTAILISFGIAIRATWALNSRSSQADRLRQIDVGPGVVMHISPASTLIDPAAGAIKTGTAATHVPRAEGN